MHVYLDSGLIDDGVRHTADASGIAAARADCIDWIWGTTGKPTGTPTVTLDVESPIVLTNLARCDKLEFPMVGTKADTNEITVHTLGYRYIPTANANGRALIVCHGHGHWAEGVGGLGRVMQTALTAGFTVVTTHLPCEFPPYNAAVEPEWGGSGDHTWLFTGVPYSVVSGSPMRFFLGLPIAVTTLLLADGATDVSVTGLSGGGWTSGMLAAVDTRIACCYPVAGTQPLYMRTGGSMGDTEQHLPRLYDMIGYLDLYLMAAYQRRMVLIYNHVDNACFGPLQYSDAGAGPRIVGLTYTQALDDMTAELRSIVGTGAVAWELMTDDSGHEYTQDAADFVVADLLT